MDRPCLLLETEAREEAERRSDFVAACRRDFAGVDQGVKAGERSSLDDFVTERIEAGEGDDRQ